MDIEGSQTITEADIADLDQRTVLRTATLVRQGSLAAFGVAGLLLLAWLWNVVRTQQLITDRFGDLGPEFGDVGLTEIPWTERVDAFTQSLSLLAFASVVAGIGLCLRIYGEVTVLRQGGQLTLWAVGDPIDEDDDA